VSARCSPLVSVLAVPQKIAVVGAGAVGGYYGAQLARVGDEVSFLLRRDLAQVRVHGLRVRQPPAGDFTLQPVRAFGTTAEIGPVDLVVIGLKATANHELRQLLPPLLGQHTTILLLQNGLGGDEFLAGSSARSGCSADCASSASTVPVPVKSPAPSGLSGAGRVHRCADAAPARTRGAVPGHRVKTIVAGDLAEARWQKLVWNVRSTVWPSRLAGDDGCHHGRRESACLGPRADG